MSIPEAARSVRDCAQSVIEAVARHGDDHQALAAALKTPIGELIRRDDLIDLGIPRQGNNVAFSQYLYFDGQLSILLFEVPTDRIIPAHDHGVWEGFCAYRGRVRHKIYQRVDDRSVDGYAELETIREDILSPGDIAIVAPPADIHSFTALDTGTFGLTIVNGPYKPERFYYQPEENTYVAMSQANRR